MRPPLLLKDGNNSELLKFFQRKLPQAKRNLLTEDALYEILTKVLEENKVNQELSPRDLLPSQKNTISVAFASQVNQASKNIAKPDSSKTSRVHRKPNVLHQAPFETITRRDTGIFPVVIWGSQEPLPVEVPNKLPALSHLNFRKPIVVKDSKKNLPLNPTVENDFAAIYSRKPNPAEKNTSEDQDKLPSVKEIRDLIKTLQKDLQAARKSSLNPDLKVFKITEKLSDYLVKATFNPPAEKNTIPKPSPRDMITTKVLLRSAIENIVL